VGGDEDCAVVSGNASGAASLLSVAFTSFASDFNSRAEAGGATLVAVAAPPHPPTTAVPAAAARRRGERRGVGLVETVRGVRKGCAPAEAVGAGVGDDTSSSAGGASLDLVSRRVTVTGTTGGLSSASPDFAAA
jgi:hypothetical protein